MALVITALISYGSALQLTTTQIACAAVFPIIGMILGYGKRCLRLYFLFLPNSRNIPTDLEAPLAKLSPISTFCGLTRQQLDKAVILRVKLNFLHFKRLKISLKNE